MDLLHISLYMQYWGKNSLRFPRYTEPLFQNFSVTIALNIDTHWINCFNVSRWRQTKFIIHTYRNKLLPIRYCIVKILLLYSQYIFDSVSECMRVRVAAQVWGQIDRVLGFMFHRLLHQNVHRKSRLFRGSSAFRQTNDVSGVKKINQIIGVC